MKIIEDEPSNLTPGMRMRLIQPDHIPYPLLVTVAVPAEEPPAGGFNGALSTDGNYTGGTVHQAFMYPAMNMELPATVCVSVGYPLDNDPPAMLARNTELTPTPWPEWDAQYGVLLGGTAPQSGKSDAFRDLRASTMKPTAALC